MKNLVQAKINRNGRTVEIIDSQVTIDGQPAADLSEVSMVLTKTLIVELFDTAVKQVENMPDKYLNGLSFDKLVTESRHLLAIRKTLQSVRDLNAERYAKGISEKTREQLCAVFGRLFRAINIDDYSIPQQTALDIITDGYIGRMIGAYDFNELFDSIKDDNSKAIELEQSFKVFPFEKYISKNEVNSIQNQVECLFKNHVDQVETFRKFRDIAGADLVNWGPHKFASQAKKHGLKSNYVIQNWANALTKHYLDKGLVQADKKQTNVQKLKEKYTDTPDELTQAEYIALFKNEGETAASQIILRHMNADTAVSLLDCTTKNVTDKLLNRQQILPGLQAIMAVVSRQSNANAFQKLRAYFERTEVSTVNWDLLINHAGLYTSEELDKWVTQTHYNLNSREFSDEFYTTVLSPLPIERQFKIHSAITHAFLSRMSVIQKQDFLISYHNVPLVLARFGQPVTKYANVDWAYSAPLFFELPYQDQLKFFSSTDVNGYGFMTYFLPSIVANHDQSASMVALQRSENSLELYSILTFEQKCAVLREKECFIELSIVFNPAELKQFVNIAISDVKLACYLDNSNMPLSDLDQNIQSSNAQLYIPLTDKTLDVLTKVSILKLIACSGFILDRSYSRRPSEYDVSLKRKLYSKISRKDFDKIFLDIVYHPDFIALVGLMSENEIRIACDRSRDFLRLNMAYVPKDYITRFKDKETFKNIVGDRRDRTNHAFGTAIEERLAA